MKTAKVEQVIEIREWVGGHGTVYFHKLKMDNGDVGEIGKKVNNAVRPGDELTYELEPNGTFPAKIKLQQQGGFGGGGNGFRGGGAKGSTASFALSYAKDLAVANIAANNAPIKMESLASTIIATASTFQTWLKENE